jgi:serine/threonine protein kinase
MAKKTPPPEHTPEPKPVLATPQGSSKIEAGGDSTGPQPFIIVDGETCKLRANASGSMGCLYFGKSVVYKTYSEERYKASVLSIEKENLQKLTSRNQTSRCFPKLLGTKEHEKRVYLKIELVDGLPLNVLLHKLDCEEFLSVLTELARGLVLLHECNIIHRDLHSGNILYNQETGRVTVIDFGISEDLDEETEVSKRPDGKTYCGQDTLRPTVKDSPQNRDIRFRDPFAVGRLIQKYLDNPARTNANTVVSDQAVVDTKSLENPEAENPAAAMHEPSLVRTNHEYFLSQLKDDLLDLNAYPDRCIDAKELLRRLVEHANPEFVIQNVPSRRDLWLSILGSRLGRAVYKGSINYKGSIKRSVEKLSRRAILAGLGVITGYLLGHRFSVPTATIEQRFARANAWFALGKRFRDDVPAKEQESRKSELQQIRNALRGLSFGVNALGSDSVTEWQKKLFENALVELDESLVATDTPGTQVAKLCNELCKDKERGIQLERLKFLGELLGKYGDVLGGSSTRENVYVASLELRSRYSAMVEDDTDPIVSAGALRELGLAHKNLAKIDRNPADSEVEFLRKLLKHQTWAATYLKDAWDKLEDAKDPTESEKSQGEILYYAGWTAFDPRDREGLWWNSEYHAEQKTAKKSPILWLKGDPQESLRIVTKVFPDQVHMWEWGMFSLDCNNPKSSFLPTGVNYELL